MPEKLLVETTWSNLRIVEDAVEGQTEKRMKVTGVVQEADIPNRNKRIYKKEVLEEALAGLKDRLQENRVFGEVDHPEVRGRLKETSHMVTKLWWDEFQPSRILGECLILNTPAGLVLKEILRAGGRPGFSSRGAGNSKKVTVNGEELEEIEKGYKLESVDFVIDPSVQSAQIHKIIEQADANEKVIQEEAMSEELTLALLKEKHPQIIDELKAEFSKEFEPKVTEADAKLKENLGRVSQLEAELNTKDKEMEKHLSVLEGIVDILSSSGYLEEYIVKENPKAAKVADEERQALIDKVTLLEKTITDQTAVLDAQKEQAAKVAEEKLKQELRNSIDEGVQGLKFGALVKTRLVEKLDSGIIKTPEDVAKYLKEDEDFAKVLASEESKILEDKGKGVVKPSNDGNDPIAEDFKRKMQSFGGMKIKKEDK